MAISRSRQSSRLILGALLLLLLAILTAARIYWQSAEEPLIADFHKKFGIEFANPLCRLHEECIPKRPTTLGALVQKVGPPEKANGTICCSPHLTHETFMFVYIRYGLVVTANRSIENIPELPLVVTPDVLVSSMQFWRSRTVDDFSLEYSQAYLMPNTQFFRRVPDWIGFGPIKGRLE